MTPNPPSPADLASEVPSLNILLVEDEPSEALLIRQMLACASTATYAVEHVERLHDARAALRDLAFDSVILDLSLPDSKGLATLLGVLEHAGPAPVLVLTGRDDETVALQALAAGAADYLIKGQMPGTLLVRTVRHAIERARAVEAAKQAQGEVGFQSRLLEAVGEAVIATDLDGSVSYWNSAAEALYGWTSQEAMGRQLQELTPAEPAQVSPGDANPELQGGEAPSGEFILRRKDGSTFPAQVLNSPLRDASGQLVGVVGISSDLTERKALETQLRLSQRMEAVGRLAGGIAHDFNNVLTVVEGNVQLLLLDMDDEALRSNVMEIRSASRRAAGLTRQLLAFSRQQVLRPKVLDLGRVVHEMEEMLRRLIGEHIELTVSCTSDLGPVEADPAQIGQVVMNLAVNARDAMPDGGQLSIRLENTELDQAFARDLPYDIVTGPYVLLAVTDTGTGMDEDTLGRIFEPFFTTKSMDKGTGLGLPTVYGIVKQSGGYIWVDSTPGSGSAFRIYFPLVDAEVDEEEAVEPTRPSQPSSEDVTILLCEDEAPVRRVARRILQRAGFSILEAASGDEALKIAKDHPGPIHLVLSDVVMPKMGGVELMTAVRTHRPGIGALLMSGYARREIPDVGLVDGGVLFLEKPFTPAELVERVGAALRDEGARKR